jgi:hypothetical protein
MGNKNPLTFFQNVKTKENTWFLELAIIPF